MKLRDGFDATVGYTPLIRLRRASKATGCEILGKAEFLNPGGSVKDRAALGIILEAEASNRIRPGGAVVVGPALQGQVVQPVIPEGKGIARAGLVGIIID